MMLEDKVVVVTGANGRLGRRLVRRLSAEGAIVAPVVRTESQVDGFESDAFVADVSEEQEVVSCFAAIADRFGRVDALVHTVGAWAAAPFLEVSLEAWDELLRVNLRSAFLCLREAAGAMKDHGGRLICITAAQGAERGEAEQAAYSAAKGGLIRLVESVADELAPDGITAHAVAAGFIQYEAGAQGGVPADDVVDVCVYLCSPPGAALNGATVRVYGRS